MRKSHSEILTRYPGENLTVRFSHGMMSFLAISRPLPDVHEDKYRVCGRIVNDALKLIVSTLARASIECVEV